MVQIPRQKMITLAGKRFKKIPSFWFSVYIW
jgi:hypothetical protein